MNSWMYKEPGIGVGMILRRSGAVLRLMRANWTRGVSVYFVALAISITATVYAQPADNGANEPPDGSGQVSGEGEDDCDLKDPFDCPAPPINTPAPTPTSTPILECDLKEEACQPPTSTPVPPTATPTPIPTATPTPEPTATPTPEPTDIPDPDIFISLLSSTIDVGGSDGFRVAATNLSYSTTYTIRVVTDNTNMGFNNRCTGQEVRSTFRFRTTYSNWRTLHGCGPGKVTVTASLYRGSDLLAQDSQSVTVEDDQPPPNAIPTCPSISNRSYQVGASVSLSLPAASGGDGTLTYTVSGLPAGLSDSGSPPTISGKPTTAGSSTVTYQARDADGDPCSEEFTITVTEEPPNATPTCPNISNRSYKVGASVSLSLPAASGGDGTLTYTVSGLPAGLSDSGSPPTISGKPTTKGLSTVTYKARDADGDPCTRTFTITVTGDDDPPTVTINTSGGTVDGGQRVPLDATATGDSPRYTWSGAGSFDNSSALDTTWTAPVVQSTTRYTLVLSVSDGGLTASDSVAFTVRASAPPPPIRCSPSFGSASVAEQIWTIGVQIKNLKLPVATGANCNLSYTLKGPSSNPDLPNGVTIWQLTPPVLRGTPTVIMAQTEYTWTAKDRGGATASLTFHITVKPAPPTNLDVTPLPEGNARFIWTKSAGNPGGTRYQAEAMDPVVVNSAMPEAWNSWSPFGRPQTCVSLSGTSEEVCSVEFDLDEIIGSQGLDDSGLFHLRVRASSGRQFSDSDEVTIVDTPITRANGSSPPDSGRVFLKWRAMQGASGGRYAVRMANLNTVDSSQRSTYWIRNETWRPPAEPPAREEPILESLPSDHQMTVTNLPGGGKLSVGADIYAIQLVYGPTTVDANGNTTIQPKIFSARDVYVWPSSAPPRRPNLSYPDGDPLEYERVATYAFFGHHAGRTYNYQVCDSSYLSQGTRYADWVALIKGAMRKWEVATNDEIRTDRDEGTTDCAGLIAPPANLPIIPPVWNVIEQEKENDNQSEIRVVDIGEGGLLWSVVLGTMSTDTYLACLGAAPACVTSRPGYSDAGRHAGKTIPSVDITFRQSRLEEDMDRFHVPASTPLSLCRPEIANPGVNGDYGLFILTLHEIGHALGLSNAASPGHYVLNFADPNIDNISHPTIPVSIMSKPKDARIDGAACSPHPFDVMAIYALYQNLPP